MEGRDKAPEQQVWIIAVTSASCLAIILDFYEDSERKRKLGSKVGWESPRPKTVSVII